MNPIYENFFQAYWKPGLREYYTESSSKEMMLTPVDQEGYFEWALIKGTLTLEDYRKVEDKYNMRLPLNFKEWHRQYFFCDGDCSIVRLPCSVPTRPLQEVIECLDWHVPEQLIPLGLIPFANEGNDTGPLVFDTRNQSDSSDYPIRVYDHEYMGDLEGLSEIIFSSFNKLIECLTHLLKETKSRESFDVIGDFFLIDPNGAGATGKQYWMSWIDMLSPNDRS